MPKEGSLGLGPLTSIVGGLQAIEHPTTSMHVGRSPRHVFERLVVCAVVVAVVLAVAPNAPAAVPGIDDAMPDITLHREGRYRNGLERGSMLGGVTLPVDWSERVSPCPSDPGAPQFRLRVAPTMHPPLCPGDESEAVLNLQILLREKKLYRGPITGVFDNQTQYAVFTFHKIIGPAHTDPRTAVADWRADPPPGDWTSQDWVMLEAFVPKPPKLRPGQADRVETDIGHQVLYLITDDQVEAIIPVSTGRGVGEQGCVPYGCGAYVTPRTELLAEGSAFYYEHNFRGGWGGDTHIYKAIFYRGQHGEWYYGIHGYGSVPMYPASMGCTRVPVWEMDYLRPSVVPNASENRVRPGMVIHVWDA